MVRNLLFAAFFLFANCNYSVNIYLPDRSNSTSEDLTKKSEANCKFDLKSKLKQLFNFEGINISTYRPDEDLEILFVQEIKACPKDEIANDIILLQTQYKDDLEIMAKSSFLLIKLDFNKNENEDILIKTYAMQKKIMSERFRDPNYTRNIEENRYSPLIRGDQIASLIADIIATEDIDNSFLSKSFELIPKVDGGSSTILFGVYMKEFEDSPEGFLKAVNNIQVSDQEIVFEQICNLTSKKELIKTLSKIPRNSEVFVKSKEIAKFVQNSENCQDY